MRLPICACAVAFSVVLLGACSDDGAQVRNLDPSADSGSGASGSGVSGSGVSGSGVSGSEVSGSEVSGSGLSSQALSGDSDDPLVQAAVTEYQAYVLAEADTLITATTRFTDAVRAGDLALAQQEYPLSRESWERIEPIAGLVKQIDGRLDARVDDFAGVVDVGVVLRVRVEALRMACVVGGLCC